MNSIDEEKEFSNEILFLEIYYWHQRLKVIELLIL